VPSIPRSVKLVAFFIVTLLALLGLTGVGVTYAYRDTFYPGITVGPLDVSGLTRAEAQEKLEAFSAQVLAREVSVAVPNLLESEDESSGKHPEEVVSIKADQLGLTLSIDAAIDEAWRIGRSKGAFTWAKEIGRLYYIGGVTVPIAAQADEELVRGFVATNVIAKAAAPQPAKIVVEGREVQITDQVPGLNIDEAVLTARVLSALQATPDTEPLALRVPAELIDAPIGRAQVEPLAEKLDLIGNTRVVMTAQGVRLAPPREELLQWYVPVLNDKNEVALGLNTERITTYLQRQRDLDQKKSLAAVEKVANDWLKEPTTLQEIALTAKPLDQVVVGSYRAGMFAGKYIYVNLREQKLYRMNGETMEKVYRVSTGKWSTPTPRGTFFIDNKHPRAYSRRFGLYMPYWQNFLGESNSGQELPKGAYGLHELPEWPNGYKEGQRHLGTAVSHGCIRLGIGDARELYEWTVIGIPVVVE
jgi:hypothetical protein